MNFLFNDILLSALTPVTLISGVGLLLLSMTNRYGHATNRIRELLKQKSAGCSAEITHIIDSEVELIFKRCWYLRKAMLCMVSSVTFSGLIVLANVMEAMFKVPLDLLECTLLVCGLALIVVSAAYFVLEISLSMHALDLTVHRGKPSFKDPIWKTCCRPVHKA